jgi:hypothetical protein
MKPHSNVSTLAAIALAGAAVLATPSQAQSGAAGASANPPSGVPNVTAPTEPVRQGAAGINPAQAEATRTTGNAARDAQATVENEIAGVGAPNANPAGQNAAASGNASAQAAMPNGPANNAANRATEMAANSPNRASTGRVSSEPSDLEGRSEKDVTRELNRQQAANASANASGTAR